MKLPRPGDMVGPYQCVRLLASGGMGAVYEAQRADLPRSVALKVLLAPEDEELVARFQREAEACARLRHPNLVPVHESGSARGACFMVMELVAGESLDGRLKREGPLDPELAVDYTIEAAAGIAHAHAAGVLHRDLKPSNLIWDHEHSRIRVIDFGLTGRLSSADSLTATGEIMGTPGYLAPEQTGVDGSLTGPLTDVYGLGATLFALLSGRAPFVSGGLQGLAEVAADRAPDLRMLRPELDAELAKIVARCLEKAPPARYESAEELSRVLTRYQEEIGESTPRRRGRLALFLGAALVLLLALGGVAGVEARRRTRLTQLEDYESWRGQALDEYAYGWGPAPPGLEGELRTWREELSPHVRTGPRWEFAASELRANLRLLAADQGRDPGFPEDPDLPPGPPDHLAEALIQLRARRPEQGALSFKRVQDRVARSQAALLTKSALEARLEPERFLNSIRPAQGAELGMLQGSFPPALIAAAPHASYEDLIRWTKAAQAAGCVEVGRALRSALGASLQRRKQELESLEVNLLGRYLRDLCTPIRQAGLWPPPEFASHGRERLESICAEFAASARTEGQEVQSLALVEFEHELFYRVEPKPFLRPVFRTGLHFAKKPAQRGASPLVRSLHRYGTHSSGFQLGHQERLAQLALAARPEPGSRLERAYVWWDTYYPQAFSPGVRLPARAHADLRDLLTTGLDDLHPGLVFKLLEAQSFLWRFRHPKDPGPTSEEIAQLSAIGEHEFTRSLEWLKELANQGVEDCLAESVGAPGRLRLLAAGPSVEARKAALAYYEGPLAILWNLERETAEDVRASGPVQGTIVKLLGRLGEASLDAGATVEALEILEPGLPFMRRRGALGVDLGRYWAAILTAYRRAGRKADALELVDQLNLDRLATALVLVLPVAEILLESNQGSRAIPQLRRAKADLQRASAPIEIARFGDSLERVDTLLEACEAQGR